MNEFWFLGILMGLAFTNFAIGAWQGYKVGLKVASFRAVTPSPNMPVEKPDETSQ